MNFQDFLVKNKAPIDWIGEQSPEQAWKTAERGDWMLWLVEHIVLDQELKHEIVRIAVECAKLVLPFTCNPRVDTCLAVVERWLADDPVTKKELRAAANDAHAAARDTNDVAAWAAAWAGIATNNDKGTAGNARCAAHAAAMAAKRAAGTAAWATTNEKCADIVRKYLPWETIVPLMERALRS